MANGVIQIDPRVGSKELLPLFTKGRAIVADSDLPADFQFLGNGPDGMCTVGIERKQTTEFIGDYDRFASNQLVPLMNNYKFRFLIVEGPYQPTQDAHVQLYERGMWQDRTHAGQVPTFKTMFGRWATLMIQTYTFVLPTVSKLHTALCVEGLYNWFQKEWHDHKSFNVEYTPPSNIVLPRMPTVHEKMVVQIPSIGWAKAIAIAEKFPNMRALCMATEEQIAAVPCGVNRVGPKSAKMVKRYIEGGV